MATLHCEIITPEGTAFSGEAEMVVVPGTEGELGVLPRHQPIVAHLDVGQIRVKVSASEWRAFASSDGYFSMQNNRALVLVEGAVPSDQIDVEAANALAEDARARIQAAEAGDEAVNAFRAKRDLEFAENQLRLAGR